MWLTLSGFLLLVLLGVAVLPVPRVRRLLFTAAARFGQAALLAVLGACGTFFVQPDAAPVAAAPLLDQVRDLLPAAAGSAPGLPWLVLAVLTVAVTLPVLIALELGVSLSRESALVQELQKDLRQAAVWVDQRLVALGVTPPPPVSPEAAAAAAAFRSTTPPPAVARPIVLDLLQ